MSKDENYDNDDLRISVDVRALRCSICQEKLDLASILGNGQERNYLAAHFAQHHAGFDHELWHDGVVAKTSDPKLRGKRISFSLQAIGEGQVHYA